MKSHLSLLLPLTTLIVMIAVFCWGYKTMYLKRDNTAQKAKSIFKKQVKKSADTYNMLDPFSAVKETSAAAKIQNTGSCENNVDSIPECIRKIDDDSGTVIFGKWKKSIKRKIRPRRRDKKIVSGRAASQKQHHRAAVRKNTRHAFPEKRKFNNSPDSDSVHRKIARSVSSRRRMENEHREKKISRKRHSGSKSGSRKKNKGFGRR